VVSPAPVIFALLVTVGVGLALPFVVLAVIPGWTRLLPKPGPWLARLRQLLAFPLLGTLVWLLSIHGQLTGAIGMTQLLAFLVTVAFATWLFGVLQRRQVALPAALAVALMIPAMAGGFTLDFPEVDRTASMSAGWQAWNEQSVTDELAAGRPVFVDFTAAWCATCKANEHLVIRSDAVEAAFARYNVSRFVADWTRPDDRIHAKLAEFGRAGVPMYLVYSPLAPDQPQLLPEILTVDSVLEALRRAADGSPAS
jgi:thiol:disulfide interchange protein DsbD